MINQALTNVNYFTDHSLRASYTVLKVDSILSILFWIFLSILFYNLQILKLAIIITLKIVVSHIENYNKLNINGIIDKCFEADFGKHTKLSEYIQKEIELEREC